MSMRSVTGSMTRSIFFKFIGLTGVSVVVAIFKSSGSKTHSNDLTNQKSLKSKRGKKAALLAGKLGLKTKNSKHY